jgi:hypothetical protein
VFGSVVRKLRPILNENARRVEVTMSKCFVISEREMTRQNIGMGLVFNGRNIFLLLFGKRLRKLNGIGVQSSENSQN